MSCETSPLPKRALARSAFEITGQHLFELPENLWNAFKTHLQQRSKRSDFRRLLDADDRILADMGITRADVIWASSLPMKVNAAQELERIRRKNHAAMRAAHERKLQRFA